MPELPETETIARDLDAEVARSRIVAVRVVRPDVLREADAAELTRRAVGATIVRAWRRAKLIVLDLSTSDRLVVQPRFTGAMLIEAPDRPLPDAERRYSTLALTLDDSRLLHYRDIRRLGTVALMSPQRWESYSRDLGVEPLDRAFTPEHLSALFRGTRRAVKKVLMDQRAVVGIGNIYANEALWRASIDPSREARTLDASDTTRLHDAIVRVLEESISLRGTSFRDYRDARGEKGGFVARLAVYGRAGLPCPTCGATLVSTHEIDGRSTVLCTRCQA